jgi:hypothetical protein
MLSLISSLRVILMNSRGVQEERIKAKNKNKVEN